MRYSRDFVPRSLFLLPAVFLPVQVSLAAVDSFRPYAFAQVLYDSNIYRVSGDFEDQESDTVGHLGAGLNADWKLSRQHLLLDAVVDRAKYDAQGELDHTRLDGRATWAWEVGNLWNGDLGYHYNKELSSFDEQLVPEKDMRTTHSGFWSAGYQIHPDWKLIAGLQYDDASYQKRDFLDRKTSTGKLEVQYRNTRSTYVGLRTEYAKNDLRDLDIAPGVSINNDYNQTTISGVFYWQGTDKSALEANLGYTDVKYDELNDRDFQGSTGRLTYHWAATGKTNLDLAIWRETSSLYDEITTYVLQKGVSIRPTWSATPKITVTGDVSYTNDDFKGRNDLASVVGAQRRDDDTWFYGLGATWQPRDYVQVSLNYRRETRDSSIDVVDYNDDQVDARVQLTF